jgi:hypothetical protein
MNIRRSIRIRAAIGLLSVLAAGCASKLTHQEPPSGTDAGVSETDAATPAHSGFVTALGTSLMLNGQKIQFIGFDAPGMFGGCWDGNNFTTSEMDNYFSRLPSNGLTRIFAVEPAGTTLIRTIVNEAAKYNQHLILSLSEDGSECNDTDGAPNGAGSGKTETYYESGWRGQYLTWINTIVPLFKDSTTVAMWEIANEPFHSGATGSQLGLSTMENYMNGAAAAIRANDPNHLIETGLADPGSCGGASNYTAVQSGSDIDVICFHDYAWDYEGKAELSTNFSVAQAAAVQLNKPFIAGEAGVEGGAGCTPSTGLSLSDRMSYLILKTNDYMSGGIGAVAFWDYERESPGCAYEILQGDPLIAAVQNYTVP